MLFSITLSVNNISLKQQESKNAFLSAWSQQLVKRNLIKLQLRFDPNGLQTLTKKTIIKN